MLLGLDEVMTDDVPKLEAQVDEAHLRSLIGARNFVV